MSARDPAPPPFYHPADYEPAVPTLKQALGFDHGERICRPEEIVRYVQALAEGNEHARLVQYGLSVEGRPLLYLAISEAENLARAEEIQANLQRLADPRVCSRDEAAGLVENTPAVCWVAANVHGGEHSSAEAALLLAYHLLAGRDEASARIRRETVVVIDPLQNPDGRERSVQYYYSAFGLRPNPDANAAEHFWPWPGPRGNHYLFDLNRDWMLLTQAETSARVRAFLAWRPQLFTDLHEMAHTSTFYFVPPAPPVNANYPEVTLRWWEAYGRAIASWFDEYGFEYYTREHFDAFYPGYGESWPSFHGATGMTFEQAAVRGLAIRRDDGLELTLRDALHHHFIAVLAACDLTAARRRERLWDHHAFHEDGVLHGEHGEIKEYLVPPQPGALALARSLAAQGIEVHVTREPFRPGQALDAVTGEAWGECLPAGTFLYRLSQPYSRYLRAVMEPRTPIPPEFLEQEVLHEQARLPDRFYDITAWSRPQALGLRLLEGRTASDVAAELLDPAARPRAALPQGRAAYLLPDTSARAVAVVAGLQRDGFRVHCARKGFALGEREYPSGAFVVRRAGNEGVRAALERALAEDRDGFEVVGAESLWTDTGVDLGSEDVVYLKPRNIAVLYDWPVSSLAFGWLAFLLEQRYRIPFTALRRDRLGARDFRDYDVLVLPDGDGYSKALDEEHDEALKRWVQGGGVLVGVGRAAAHLCRPEAGLTAVRVVKDLRNTGPEGAVTPEGEKEGEQKEPVPYEHRPVRVPGAFLRVDLDAHHPLTFGYPSATEVFYEGSLLLRRGPETHPVAAFAPAERLRSSGFVWEKMERALPGHLWAADETCGHGHVVLFASDPAYRVAWDHMHRFLLNALLILPSVKRPS